MQFTSWISRYKILKKTGALFLLFLFTLHLTGVYVVLQIEQTRLKKNIKTSIKKGINPRQLIAITVNLQTEKEIYWEEAKKEFRYQGKFYDVVKSEKINEHETLYYCIDDKQEQQLLENLDQEISKMLDIETQHKHSPIQRTIKLFSSLFVQQSLDNDDSPIHIVEILTHQCSNTLHYPLPTYGVENPPPQGFW